MLHAQHKRCKKWILCEVERFHVMILNVSSPPPPPSSPLSPVTATTTPRVRSSNRRREKIRHVQSVATRRRRPKTSACPVSVAQTVRGLEVGFRSRKTAAKRKLLRLRLPPLSQWFLRKRNWVFCLFQNKVKKVSTTKPWYSKLESLFDNHVSLKLLPVFCLLY